MGKVFDRDLDQGSDVVVVEPVVDVATVATVPDDTRRAQQPKRL